MYKIQPKPHIRAYINLTNTLSRKKIARDIIRGYTNIPAKKCKPQNGAIVKPIANPLSMRWIVTDMYPNLTNKMHTIKNRAKNEVNSSKPLWLVKNADKAMTIDEAKPIVPN